MSKTKHTPTWLYLKSEPGLFTVGFYKPDGQWEPESDHSSDTAAANRVHWLNGGSKTHDRLLEALKKCEDVIGRARLEGKLSNSPFSPVNYALTEARIALDAEREVEQ